MRVSITQVAVEAGVTPAVVSRVLNGDESLRVRPETRQRVVDAARRLDYTPNAAARSLRRSRANAIGLAVHDMSNPLYGEIVRGAQRAAAAEGLVLLLADVDSLARGDAAARRSIQGGAIDGLLLQRAGGSADRRILTGANARVPTVLVNDRSRSTASVGLDDRAGAHLATSHLTGLGHRRIAHVSVGGTGRSAARVAGWRAALKEVGAAAGDCPDIRGGHTITAGERAMAELLQREPRPTGVVVGNVLAAIGGLTAAVRAGVRVPEELSIVAFHDLEFAAHTTPTLTTVALPMEELGVQSVQLLLDLLGGGQPHHLVVDDPAPRLIVRKSSGPPSR